MQPRWFIQEGCFPEHEEKVLLNLLNVLREADCQIICNRYKPFGAMEYDFFDATCPSVVHGSIEIMKHCLSMRDDGGWWPVGWMDLPTLSCVSYYSQLGKHLLQNPYGFYPYSELRRLAAHLFDTFGVPKSARETNTLGRLIFIRPNSNDKSFTGTVVGEKMFNSWHSSESTFSGGHCEPDTLCVVSAFQHIEREWRLVIADQKVVAGSLYKEADHLAVERGFPDEVGSFAEEVANVWSPHPVWVLDIAESQGELKVLELGSVNCAGWYACDLRAVVAAINKVAVREWEEARAAYDHSGDNKTEAAAGCAVGPQQLVAAEVDVSGTLRTGPGSLETQSGTGTASGGTCVAD